MRRMSKMVALGAAALILAGCANDGRLMNLRNTESGPDEFAVLPTAPIEVPTDLASLPTPTPGGSNRVDPTPQADAIAALGGNAERGSNAGDFVSYASRFGVSEDIRGVLAAEDRVFRDENQGRVLERLFGVNVYFSAYRQMSLDQYAELERLRASGVRTPAAPPPEIELGEE